MWNTDRRTACCSAGSGSTKRR
uniref:Uncharacterized protein n=1 Tax=Anguilla anguilla TaxID=7936 RepID=A0A0E9TW59_ANGAN